MERLFFFVTLMMLLLVAGPVQAQGPVLSGVVTGVDPITDQPYTETITIELSNAYTATLDTGQMFLLERRVTYGDVISGAGALMVFLLMLFIYIERLVRGAASR